MNMCSCTPTIDKNKINFGDLSFSLSRLNETEKKLERSEIAKIGKMKNLQTLLMSSTGLYFIPPEFSQLINLEILSLSYNSIEEEKDDWKVLSNLPNLKKLSVGPKSWINTKEDDLEKILPNININFNGPKDIFS